MAALSHVKSNTIGDFTGTVTVFNSQGSTATANATDLVRPGDWNSAHNFFQTISGNTAGQSTASGTNLVIGGTNGATVSLSTGASAATLWVNAPAGGTATLWQPFNEGVNVGGQAGNATIHIVPLPTPAPAALGELQVDRLCVPLYFSNASNSTGTASISFSMGLYTRNVSSLSLVHSTSYSTAVTFSGTSSASLHNGIRLHTIPWTTTIGDGRYYVAQWSRTSTGGANATFSQMLVSQLNSNFSGVFGAASNRSNQWPLGYGVFSASVSTAMPSSIAFSQIDGTASLAARTPSFFMISGTA